MKRLGKVIRSVQAFGRELSGRPIEGKRIQSIVEDRIIHFSRLLRPDNNLTCFVEPLQSKGVVGEIPVFTYSIRCKV